jgi:hypothetical protein
MATRATYDAGQPAPSSATYEQINLFGASTGIKIQVQRGRPLPLTPIGHQWVVDEKERPRSQQDC